MLIASSSTAKPEDNLRARPSRSSSETRFFEQHLRHFLVGRVERSGTRRRKLGSTSFHPTYEWYFFILAYGLEKRFGKYVETEFGGFKRNINRMPADGSKTWHFYYKEDKWVGAVQFTPEPVFQVSRPINYGAIGLDINPGSIGWAYCDVARLPRSLTAYQEREEGKARLERVEQIK